MTSQGQRFRRRSLRRGYKIEEVDTFLDRVEATLNGERVDNPVRAQEVHDVVFRVRFGGYDEWQVDLHLDRVERQLADQEASSDFIPERMMPERMPDRMMPERLPERFRDERGPMDRPPMDRPPMDRPMDRPPMDRPPMPERAMHERPMERPMPSPHMPVAGGMPPNGMPSTGPMPVPGHGPLPTRPTPNTGTSTGGFPQYVEQTYAGQQGPGFGGRREPEQQEFGGMPPAGYRQTQPPPPPAYPEPPAYNSGGFNRGEQGRIDMTSDLRIPPPPPAGPPGGGMPPSGDAQRIDQMRRAFQMRRFGSGYDRAEVDRLFDGIMGAMSGRGSVPGDQDLDPRQFNLVPGGYYEDEVDQALREVRDMFRRR